MTDSELPRHVIIRSTPFGPVVIIWSVSEKQPSVIRLLLSKPELSAPERMDKLFPGSSFSSCTEIDALARRIQAFLRGDDVSFSLNISRFDLCSPFQRSVLRAECLIPRGKVSTYSLIADYLGKAGAARAVGKALSKNPFPIIVPCHRAIRSDRTLGGYQGGVEMKRALLEAEGIQFDEYGRVLPSQVLHGICDG